MFIFEFLQGPSNAPLAWAAAFAGVLLLLFVGVVRLSVPSAVKIKSDPAGAEVLVDGVLRGQTPIKLAGLSRGRHTLEVREAGYEGKTLDFEIAAFAPSQKSVSLTKREEPVAQAVAPNQPEGGSRGLASIFAVGAPSETPAKSADRRKGKVTLGPSHPEQWQGRRASGH